MQCEKLSAFKAKLQLHIRCVKKGNWVNFSSIQDTLKEIASLHLHLVSTIAKYLQIFSTALDGYFSSGEKQTCDYWIHHPFDDNSDIMEDLIDMRNNTGIK